MSGYKNWQYCTRGNYQTCPRNCTCCNSENRSSQDFASFPQHYQLERGPNQQPPFLTTKPLEEGIFSFQCYNKPKFPMNYPGKTPVINYTMSPWFAPL